MLFRSDSKREQKALHTSADSSADSDEHAWLERFGRWSPVRLLQFRASACEHVLPSLVDWLESAHAQQPQTEKQHRAFAEQFQAAADAAELIAVHLDKA